MSRKLPDRLNRSSIENAIRDLDNGRNHNFADSTEYDVLFQGRRYPPKAVVGVAAEIQTGEKYAPRDFSGGHGSKCFRLLDEAGFVIVTKQVKTRLPRVLRGNERSLRKATENEFHEELLSLYRRTGEATGGEYWPHRFLRSVREKGGLPFAKKLVAAGTVSSGFEKIASVHRADLSVEAVVLDPRFSHLFSDDELATARMRLEALPLDAFPSEFALPAEQLPDEVPAGEDFIEGAKKTVAVNRYERDPKARKACIKHFGSRCAVCDLNFEERYGEIGKGFIHVHHKRPLHNLKVSYKVDPRRDLIPVCPNCHAMLHTSNPPMDIEQLRGQLLDHD